MESLTPTDPNQRGAQLSIRLSRNVKQMFEEIEKHGVVVRILEKKLNYYIIQRF